MNINTVFKINTIAGLVLLVVHPMVKLTVQESTLSIILISVTLIKEFGLLADKIITVQEKVVVLFIVMIKEDTYKQVVALLKPMLVVLMNGKNLSLKWLNKENYPKMKKKYV